MTTTHGSTTFTTTGDQVTITRHDQPVCTVPHNDLWKFVLSEMTLPDNKVWVEYSNEVWGSGSEVQSPDDVQGTEGVRIVPDPESRLGVYSEE